MKTNLASGGAKVQPLYLSTEERVNNVIDTHI